MEYLHRIKEWFESERTVNVQLPAVNRGIYSAVRSSEALILKLCAAEARTQDTEAAPAEWDHKTRYGHVKPFRGTQVGESEATCPEAGDPC